MAKVRVSALAKEVGVTSKVLLERLNGMGEYVKSASSTIEPPVVRRYREKFPETAAPKAAAPAPATKAAPAKGETPSSTHDHSGQPAARPSVSGSSRATSVTASSTVPGRSTRAGSSERVSGTDFHASTSATAAMGTLTRKIDRQPVPARSAATSTPPSTCPTTLAMPAVAP